MFQYTRTHLPCRYRALLAVFYQCLNREVILPIRPCFKGPLADGAIERGIPVSTVRKGAQGIAFLGPATFMAAACFGDDLYQTVGLLTVGLSLAGTDGYCSPRHRMPSNSRTEGLNALLLATS